MIQLSSFHTFGFGGSRSGSPACLAACTQFAAQVPAGAQVVTTCGRGAPAVIRAAFPAAQVHRRPVYRHRPCCIRSPRRRHGSQHCRQPFALVCLFPRLPLPGQPPPRWSWQSSGSGSWSECAMCAGLGVPVLVFLPAAIQPRPAGVVGSPRAPVGFFFHHPPLPCFSPAGSDPARRLFPFSGHFSTFSPFACAKSCIFLHYICIFCIF